MEIPHWPFWDEGAHIRQTLSSSSVTRLTFLSDELRRWDVDSHLVLPTQLQSVVGVVFCRQLTFSTCADLTDFNCDVWYHNQGDADWILPTFVNMRAAFPSLVQPHFSVRFTSRDQKDTDAITLKEILANIYPAAVVSCVLPPVSVYCRVSFGCASVDDVVDHLREIMGKELNCDFTLRRRSTELLIQLQYKEEEEALVAWNRFTERGIRSTMDEDVYFSW